MTSSVVGVFRRKSFVQGAVFALSLLILFGGVGLLMLGGFLTGFTRPVWLFVAGIASLPVFLIVLIGGLVAASRLPETSPKTPAYFAQTPRAVPSILSVVPLVAGLLFIGVGLQIAIPALTLGSHPSRATAQSVAQLPLPCTKCAQPVYVRFVTVDGQRVDAELAGADGIMSGDHAGLLLVYDPVEPTRVMRESDWRDGRGARAAGLVALGPAVIGGLVGLIWANVHYRRRKFGQLKPGVSIVQVRTRPARSGVAWQVSFADGTRTKYVDSQRLRAALRERILLPPGPQIEPEDGDLLNADLARQRGATS